MRFADFKRRIASRTGASSSARGRQRSRISGCSLLTTSTRAPPARIAGSSAACCRPSTVQSTTSAQRDERLHRGVVAAERRRCAGRAHRHGARRGRRHRDHERARTELLQGQRRQLHQHRPRLRLGQHRAGIAAPCTPQRPSTSTNAASQRCLRGITRLLPAGGSARRDTPAAAPPACCSLQHAADVQAVVAGGLLRQPLALEHRRAAGQHRHAVQAVVPLPFVELLATGEAKRRDTSTWPSPSTLIAKCVAASNAARLGLARRSDHSTSGGSSDSALNELTVRPKATPSAPRQVTTVTPVAKAPSAARSAAGVDGVGGGNGA